MNFFAYLDELPRVHYESLYVRPSVAGQIENQPLEHHTGVLQPLARISLLLSISLIGFRAIGRPDWVLFALVAALAPLYTIRSSNKPKKKLLIKPKLTFSQWNFEIGIFFGVS